MTLKYKFVNGEEVYVEVYGRLEKVVAKLDRNLYDNNLRETTRHISLNAIGKNRQFFLDPYIDFGE